MGGLSIGVFWGVLVSAVGLAALSLSSPLPPRDGGSVVEASVDAVVEAPEEVPAQEGTVGETGPDDEAAEETPSVAEQSGTPADVPQDGAPDAAAPATEIPLPSGSEFNRPPPEPEAALPAPDAAPAANAPQAPTVTGEVSSPSFDTTPAAQPSVVAESPAALPEAPGAVEAPASPAAGQAPAIADGPAALTQPEASATPQVRTSLLPQVTAEPELEAEAEPTALQTPEFPTVGEAAEEVSEAPAPEAAPAEDVAAEESAALTTPAFPQTSSLPQVAPEAPVAAEPEEAAAPTAEGEEAAVAEDLPAIQAHAAPFDTAEERPMMAIVLIDEPDSRIELSTLTRFSFPVAFAVDPLHPDAGARAAAYREAGFEVVILGSMIADGATATDTEVALEAAFSTLPEAVALIDTPEGRIQGDRPVLDATVAALGQSGHGLLAFPRGLNAAEQSASRAGVPGATVFRFLDDEDQRATVITRFLSRAAFAAAQEGEVIVVGRTRPDTVTALFSWALGGRSEAVALAPLSATLLRGSGE